MAIRTIKFQDKVFDISYEILNPDQKQIIIFLHGWGSNKQIMKQAFGKYLTSLQHIYIDMPGFGKSSNKYVLTTKNYGEIINIFLQQLQIKPTDIIIAGHSFGGKVATLLNPKILILLSSAGIVEKKSAKTLLTIRIAKIFNKFGLAKVTKLLRSSDVNMMSENMYGTFKNVVDEDFSQYFAKYTGKAILFWGERDTATTLNSGKTINNLISNSVLFSYDDDHYFFLRHSNDISSKIESSL